MRTIKATPLPTTRCALAECPRWDVLRGSVFYLDLAEPTLIEWNAVSQAERRHKLQLPPPLGGLCLRVDGSFAVFCSLGLIGLAEPSNDTGAPGAPLHLLVPPDVSFERAPPNDAAVHPRGVIFVATADAKEAQPSAGVFVVTPQKAFRRIASGYTVANGPAFSTDGRTVYLADSAKGQIFSCDWNDSSGALEHGKIFASASTAAGLPDGMAVDVEGGVWSARWGGGAVVRYTSQGQPVLTVDVPAKRVTSCAFGGPELRTLFITTAFDDCAPTGDLGGLLFSAEVEVSGSLPVRIDL